MDDENKTSALTSVDRRPIKTRSAWWAQGITRVLVETGISPNQVSVISILFALAGAFLFAMEAKGNASAWLFLGAAVCIQLRLLANMLDGLIAVEGGRMTKTGELYNEIPDRIADVAFLAAAGYASHHGQWGVALGWSAAVLAVNTAYLRAIGARRGQPQDFCGPQAKPQRMFLLTVACILAFAEKLVGMPPRILFIFLVVINLGTLITCIRRTVRLARQLEST
jgi:phosphatidylglycerophosphate synthase